MALDQRCDRLRQAPTVSSIGGGVVLLIDSPPTACTGKGQLGTRQLLQQIPTAAQRLHYRTDQAPIAGALADLGVLVQEAVGNQRHLAWRILLHWLTCSRRGYAARPRPMMPEFERLLTMNATGARPASAAAPAVCVGRRMCVCDAAGRVAIDVAHGHPGNSRGLREPSDRQPHEKAAST